MPETPREPEEIEKIKYFISAFAKEMCRIFNKPEHDLDQLFPQYAPFEKDKEPQGDPELDEKDEKIDSL